MKLTLLPETEESKREIMKRAHEKVDCLLGYITGVNVRGEITLEDARRYASLAQDLSYARFWDALTILDGSDFHGGISGSSSKSEEQWLKDNAQRRKWATESIYEPDLEEIFNISVNQALLKPVQTGWPGSRIPHLILYGHLVKKPDSRFRGVLSGDFVKKLQNGGFWEALGSDSLEARSHLEEVLTDQMNQLDPNFAAYGIGLLKDVNQEGVGLRTYRNLSSLTEGALENYIKFLTEVDKKDTVAKEELTPLIGAYVQEVLRWDGEYDQPVYRGGEEEVEGKTIHIGKFDEKIQRGIVWHYLNDSEQLRGQTAQVLAERTKEDNEYGEVSNFIGGVLYSIPKSQEMITLMRANGMSKDFLNASKKHGYDLNKIASRQ